jgi:hypothetical protein
MCFFLTWKAALRLAAIGVIWIDEAALLDQETHDLFFPAGKPLAVTRRRNPQDFCALLAFDAEISITIFVRSTVSTS